MQVLAPFFRCLIIHHAILVACIVRYVRKAFGGSQPRKVECAVYFAHLGKNVEAFLNLEGKPVLYGVIQCQVYGHGLKGWKSWNIYLLNW